MESSGRRAFDVIVIGGGIIGSSTAYQTSKCGLTTLLLEQFDFLHHRGSSHGESRTTRATYPEDCYSEMVLESTRLWEQAEAEAGYKVYFKTRQLDLGPSGSKSLRAIIEACRRNSIPARVFDRDGMAEEFSGVFRLPDGWIGVVTEHGGVIKPTKAVSMYHALALRNGAVLKDNAEVTDVGKDEESGEITVFTIDGVTYRCRKCVIAAGAWTARLVERVRGLVLPIQPLETSIQYWRIKEGHEGKFTIGSGFPTFNSYGEPHVYGTPSLEFPRLVKVPVHAGQACGPDDRAWAAPAVLVEAAREWIRGRFGDLVDADGGPEMTQSCVYSMTPDEDFVIDFLGGEFGEDAVVCGGFSGHGFKMAPVVGRVAAEMVASGRADWVDLRRFRIGRFEGNYGKGNEKDYDDQVKLY